MITKEIILDFPNNPAPQIQFLRTGLMEKTAGYNKELMDYIDKMEKKSGKAYLLINALSAGEYFGPNRNGDYFPESQLINHHKTYEKLGYQYLKHDNKDPKRALGKVIYAYYNPDMKRVEIISELDKDKNSEVIKRLEKGEKIAVSMGTRVSYDICSICGNKAHSISEYCTHLRTQMNDIYPDGRRVYAINVEPKFFDSSFVDRPAELTAGVMAKLGQDNTEVKLENKSADIKKEVPGETAELLEDPNNLIYRTQKKIKKDKLKKLAELPIENVLSTFIATQIVPRPQEFQYLFLTNYGHEKLAEAMDAGGYLFPISKKAIELNFLSSNHIDKRVVDILYEDLPDLVSTKINLLARFAKYANIIEDVKEKIPIREPSVLKKFFIDQEKGVELSPVKNPIPPMAVLGTLYYSLIELATKFGKAPSSFGELEQAVLKYPWLLPILIAGTGAATLGLQKILMEKQAAHTPFLRNMFIAFPASYLYAGVQEHKVRKGEQVGEFGNRIRKNPFLGGLTGMLALHTLPKLFLKKGDLNSFTLELTTLGTDKINAIYGGLINEC